MYPEEKGEDLTSLDHLASYVPALVTRRLASDPTPISTPHKETFTAVVFYADIPGFNALPEVLAQAGPIGAKELSHLLRAYSGKLFDLITTHGGDVIKFAGDTLLALWSVQSVETGKDFVSVARGAAQCGLAIQAAMHGHELAEGVRLPVQIGIAAGEVSVAHVGGVFGRWELLVSGPPLVRATTAAKQARSGQVILSPELWAIVKEACDGTPLLEGGFTHLQTMHTSLPPPRPHKISMTPEMDAGVRAYIHGATLPHLAAGHRDWMADQRRITVLFVKLPEVNTNTTLESIQHIMRTLQTNLYLYEGSINTLNMGNTGTTAVVALGLPPYTHGDDPARGVLTAQAIQAELQASGVSSTIGIATGRAFCGTLGSTARREYTMVGNVVNLAEALMQAARTGEVLCDPTTYEAARDRLAFETLGTLIVKGEPDSVVTYRPKGQLPAVVRPGRELIGRVKERTVLGKSLQALLRGAQQSLIVINGQTGIGKTRLVEDLLRLALAVSASPLLGVGDAVERSTPYHVWRPIFSRLLQLHTSASRESRQNQVLECLTSAAPENQGDPQRLLKLAPLLNAILPLDLPENELTAQMPSEVRADNTRELLVTLLQKAADESPLLLVLEDAHWFDTASWALAWSVFQSVRPIFMLITTRPMEEPFPHEYSLMLAEPTVQYLKLEELSEEETLALVCQRLGVASVPQPVADFIRDKAEGHPFFSEELAYALRDTGVILISGEECRIAPHADDLSQLRFPQSINNVILSRVDRLSPQHQLTLKVASVIGRFFSYHTLHDIYPTGVDRDHLIEHLVSLEKLDITAMAKPEPELAYLFKHIITQEVVYNLMLFSQRKQLHQAVAEWFERSHADDLAPFYPLLAHHWSRADLPSKAIEYLEKAGEQALRSYANQEAVRFFSEALQTAEYYEIDLDALQVARWERQLGEACYGLGNLAESRGYLQRAIEKLGWSVPSTNGKLAWAMLGQSARQLLHRLLPVNIVKRGAEKQVYLEAARTFTQLGSIYFLSNETAQTLSATLYTLNLAERAGASSELIRAYANISSAFGLVAFHSLAKLYREKAWETAQSIQHLPDLGYISMVTGLYYAGTGDWDQVRGYLNRAIQIYEQLGDRQRLGESRTILAVAIGFADQSSQCTQLFTEIHESAKRSGNDLQRAWGLVGLAEEKLRLGEASLAEGYLEEALECLAKNTDRSEEIRAHGLLGVARLRQGKYALARESAQAANRLSEALPTVFSTLVSYAGVAEVYLALWDEASSPESKEQAETISLEPSELSILARQACKALHRFKRVFPIGQPRAWLYQGIYDHQAGKPGRAHKSWQKSLAAAKKLKMPYDQGLAHYHIGIHLDPANPERKTHLEQAIEYFTQADSRWDLERASQALAQSQPPG